MKEEKCKYIRTDVRYKNIYQIMLAISQNKGNDCGYEDTEGEWFIRVKLAEVYKGGE